MTVCPKCHTVHGDEHRFCQRCGNPLVPEENVPPNYCSNCGTPYFPGQHFCTECGQRIKGTAESRPPRRPTVQDDLFYQPRPSRSRSQPTLTKKGFPKWTVGLVGLIIVAGAYFLWPQTSNRTPMVASPGTPVVSSPPVGRIDTLQREVERLAEKIRSAHMNKDMNLFISCYSPSYPDLGKLERETYETWKNFDFRTVSYNISNIRQFGPRHATADLVWNFQLYNNQTKAYELHRAVVNVTLEEIGGIWKIRESKDMGYS
ncbi:double zinc ribbon domain-containing protein [Desulfobacca acetoxidans]|uniref:DZANK-type domain-containing protein n=1 Tax=Desulfobacca acetoxidans (strain ATCC 700848 / DSM 11109 / ASRB2) TaxID=880072 RepID=F2NDE8_DESAR|nr:zinc ribbon domain-containing protein [Desulfobacca acetoxidans]AEB10014.1 hypothetical protein Desac_2185 [Desulfobacca acetoxidans DSM 11109]HAY21871.1 hypothetical protein [Desulfobacterales bacterium]